MTVMSKIAKAEPLATDAAFVSGFKHKTGILHQNIKHHLTQLDAFVDNVFIIAITDDNICTDDERFLLSLTVKKGGLAITIFSAVADHEFTNSRIAIE